MHNNNNNQFSCCCTKSDCDNLGKFNDSFKRVENDAHLAAEIGQALLDEKKGDLQYDLFKDNYDEVKKLRWENEESMEMIRLLKSEIKSITLNSNELKKTIENYEQQVQKSKLVEQLLVVKTDIEEELKTQISDLKQELFQLRKSENNMILKYKRLNSNHETLQLTYDELSQEHDQLIKSFISKENYELNQTLLTHSKEKRKLLSPPSMKLTPSEIKCPAKNGIPEPIPNKIIKRKQVATTTTTTVPPQFHMTITNSNKNPFDVLHSVTQQTFDKINATDTRVLNRRLRRVFDMSELSDLSNSILSGILVDLSEFNTQFDWVHDYYDQDSTIEYFFPLVNSIQDLLKEVGTMKMTLNDLQADYVKRIESLTTVKNSYQLQHPSYVKLSSSSTKVEYLVKDNHKRKSLIEGLLSLFIVK